MFSNRSSSVYSVCLVLSKLVTHHLCANTEKIWNRFSNFDFKSFGEFLKFYIWTYIVCSRQFKISLDWF